MTFTKNTKILKMFFIILYVAIIEGCIPSAISLIPTQNKLPPDTMLIAVDGVGFDIIKDAKNRGSFKNFSQPSRVITAFPSMSINCFSSIIEDLSATKNPGYDIWYYDIEKQETFGGTKGDGFKLSHSYAQFFDFGRRSGWNHNSAYFFPNEALAKDLNDIEKRVEMGQTPQMVYLIATDAIAHVHGYDELLLQVSYISESIERMQKIHQAKTGKELKVVLFSDHGQEWETESKRISDKAIIESLESVGYKRTTSLKNPKDIILYAFNNVHMGIIHTKKEDRKLASEIISQQKGIELTFYKTDNGIMVLNNKKETALIECSNDKYRYNQINGDPLLYSQVISKMQDNNLIEKDGWSSKTNWFNSTKTHYFPDALYRTCASFTDAVKYPADIIFTTETRAMFGPWMLEFASNLAFGGIKGNHGGLKQLESSAFIMSTEKSILIEKDTSYTHILRDIVFNGKEKPTSAVIFSIDEK